MFSNFIYLSKIAAGFSVTATSCVDNQLFTTSWQCLPLLSGLWKIAF